ncbi:polysaccharide pyruvyl transferase family protein [Membranihabitans marinus]|uniref:polysaccharide pyruvyl transferase family protein n=1 Tax=Membranihabitans marinus TaxID=1227546 RepID=UPI001F3926AA|nr:polysaccharide pyruvyl transferase family protein [Membranihabitans marinus]
MKERRDFIKTSILGSAGLTIGDINISSKFFDNLKARKSSKSNTYTVLTTSPPYGSQNVGDKLIEQRTKDLVLREKGDVEFLTIFREEPLEPYLEEINKTRAILLPAFPIRDTPMYPGVYRLTEDLSKIKVPMIPIGANWNVYPGDRESRNTLSYSDATRNFIHYINNQVDVMSCRESYTLDILSKHGIENTIMTGDPAWYTIESLGKPMYRPKEVKKVVFSPPLSPYYLEQGKSVIRLLAKLFPDAEKTCAFHLFDADSYKESDAKSENSAALNPDVTAKNRAVREYAKSKGFQIKEMAGDLKNLDFYESCDLHVGYECHAHLNFFSRRIPSVLIAEDARGVGFNYTIGVGGFDGFLRVQSKSTSGNKTITSGYCTSIEELVLAPPKTNLHIEIEDFLRHELESGFRKYIGLAAYLDDVYENKMRPFIQSLP